MDILQSEFIFDAATTLSNQKGQHPAQVEDTQTGYLIKFPSTANTDYVPQYCLATESGFNNHGNYSPTSIHIYDYNTVNNPIRASFYITIWKH